MLNPILAEKERAAIEFLKAMERPEGYYLAFSGGKDSCIIKHLADKAGVKYKAVYRVTSVDPPELVRFIKEKHPDVIREIPHDKEGKPITMWSLIRKKHMLPTRIARFCCADLKETGGDGMMTITGVRWAESSNRKNNQGKVTITEKKHSLQGDTNFQQTARGGVVLVNDNEESRRTIEACYKRHKTLINPIIDWEDSEVWSYIREENIPYCSLYDEGFARLGCIGCPMARYKGRVQEFARFPKYKEKYMRCAEEIIQYQLANGKKPVSKDGEAYFKRWIEDPNLPGQLSIFDGEEEDESENDDIN